MRLLSRMVGGEAFRGIRVEHAWRRKPPLGNRGHALPRHPTLLTATAQNVPPHAKHPFPEHAEAVQISGYCVVVEVALHNCAEPCAGVRRSVVHAFAELLLDLLQLCPHTLADRHAPYGEASVPVFSADVRKAQKIERLRLAFSSSRSIFFGEPPELDQTRFVWMEFQPELRQPFPKVFQKTLCFRSVLEAQGEIIRITHGDRVSVCALSAPLVQPEIEGVMQVDVRQHR